MIEFMITDLREQAESGSAIIETMDVVEPAGARLLRPQRVEDLGPDSLDRRARVLIAIGEDENSAATPTARRKPFTRRTERPEQCWPASRRIPSASSRIRRANIGLP